MVIEMELKAEYSAAILWNAIDALRNEPIPSSDYNVILFLLSAFNEGYVSDQDIKITSGNVIESSYNDYLIDNLFNYSVESYEDGRKLFEIFEFTVRAITRRGLQLILHVFNQLDKTVLSENFGKIFDQILYRISESQGSIGGEALQPTEITRLISSIADLKPSSSVYNPFAGVASFGLMSSKCQRYIGQEVTERTWALGILRLAAHKINDSALLMNVNSIVQWQGTDQRFDLVVSNPPIGLKINKDFIDFHEDVTSIEGFLIERGINSIKPNGKLIAVFSVGILFRGGAEMRLRKKLIELDLVETIVLLPSGLLMNTDIPIIVLVLNKSKTKSGVVKFIDASSFSSGKGRKKVLSYEALIDVIHSSGSNPDVVRLVENKSIADNAYNLNVSRYFGKEYHGKELSEILTVILPEAKTNEVGKKIVRIRDLQEDQLDYLLDYESLQDLDFEKLSVRWVDQSCLLVAKKGKTLKPTFFRYNGHPVGVINDILVFKVDESVVNAHYLISELRAEYVEAQLDTFRTGVSIPFIKKSDFLGIKINLLSLKEQIAKVDGLEALSYKFKLLEQEKNALAHRSSTSNFDEFKSLKHTLGRPRQNILDWSDNLIHFLKGRGGDIQYLNKAFADFYDIDMISALTEIKRDINYMSEILEKGENGLVLNNYPLELVSLSETNALINGISHNGFNFRLKKISIKGESLRNRGFECNSTLLKTLIDNILTNANKHGFLAKEVANEVIIELSEVESLLILEIKNNGKPFSKNFDKEKFISKYSTANPEIGSGLGGYDINRIAEYFNNPKWELILAEDPIYPVQFKFQFPIKLAK